MDTDTQTKTQIHTHTHTQDHHTKTLAMNRLRTSDDVFLDACGAVRASVAALADAMAADTVALPALPVVVAHPKPERDVAQVDGARL